MDANDSVPGIWNSRVNEQTDMDASILFLYIILNNCIHTSPLY